MIYIVRFKNLYAKVTALNRLIVIPPSHYCEKARWALRLAQIEFIEEAHPPFFHVSAVKKAGGTRSTPTLVTKDGVFGDSVDILLWIQGLSTSQWKPYGDQADLIQEIKDWEQDFGKNLGPHTRRLTYFHLFQCSKKISLPALINKAPKSEQKWLSRLWPMIKLLMKKSLRIDQAGAERSKIKINQCFEQVAERLNTQKKFGHHYLVGDTLSAADLSFASLAAPILLPDEYGALLPKLSDLSQDIQQMTHEYRSHPAGQFALRIYKELIAQ